MTFSITHPEKKFSGYYHYAPIHFMLNSTTSVSALYAYLMSSRYKYFLYSFWLTEYVKVQNFDCSYGR